MTTLTTPSAPSALTALLPGPARELLHETVRGNVIEPGDPAYDEARRVYNAIHDRRPAVVVLAVDAGDVIAAMHTARDHALPLAVRGGSQAVAGHGTCDDGLVVDLSRMRSVRVDPVPGPHVPRAAVPGATSITPRTPSASPPPAGSSPPPESPASPSAAAWGTSPAAAA